MSKSKNRISLSHSKTLLIDSKYFGYLDDQNVAKSREEITLELEKNNVKFENAMLPVSLRPIVLHNNDLLGVARDLQEIRRCIIRILSSLRNDLSEKKDSIVTEFFDFYRPWFDLIGGEVRHNDLIMLMRYDAVRQPNGTWMVMEPCCSSPGGIIHCAHVRDSWMKSELGRSVCEGVDLVERDIDNAEGFLTELIDASPITNAPNIAACNYEGYYTNELGSLKTAHANMVKQGRTFGSFTIADIRDVEEKDGQIFIGDTKIDVIYNKLRPMTIDPSDPELSGWVSASRNGECEFLNSLASQYVGDAKSMFAALHSPEIQTAMEFSETEIASIQRRVPATSLLNKKHLTLPITELIANRHQYVIKSDFGTRGAGVFVGKETTAEEWTNVIMEAGVCNSVIQDLIHVPQRNTLTLNQNAKILNEETEFYGLDFFFFGEKFAGVVSRCHSAMVFNVGSGGQEVPTLVVK